MFKNTELLFTTTKTTLGDVLEKYFSVGPHDNAYRAKKTLKILSNLSKAHAAEVAQNKKVVETGKVLSVKDGVVKASGLLM